MALLGLYHLSTKKSILTTYTNNFDILVSLNQYSAWGPDNHIKVLAHHKSGWYKIEINRQFCSNPYTECYSTIKINDSTGDTIWRSINENHLFEMADDRSGFAKPCPVIITDTIIENGKKEVILRGTSGSDMPEYEFEIITAKNYKKLYFYSPREKYGYCPKTDELKWIIASINVFEKYLGN